VDKVQGRAGEQQNARGPETSPPERNTKINRPIAAPRLRRAKNDVHTRPSQSMPAGAVKESAIDLTIQVRDVSAAIGEIEAHLRQANARIIESNAARVEYS